MATENVLPTSLFVLGEKTGDTSCSVSGKQCGNIVFVCVWTSEENLRFWLESQGAETSYFEVKSLFLFEILRQFDKEVNYLVIDALPSQVPFDGDTEFDELSSEQKLPLEDAHAVWPSIRHSLHREILARLESEEINEEGLSIAKSIICGPNGGYKAVSKAVKALGEWTEDARRQMEGLSAAIAEFYETVQGVVRELDHSCENCGNNGWKMVEADPVEGSAVIACERCGLTATLHAGGNEPNRRKAIPKSVQREVWRRDEGRCVECGSKENLEFDHIIPRSKGGSDTTRNIQLLCETCNRQKSDSDPGSW